MDDELRRLAPCNPGSDGRPGHTAADGPDAGAPASVDWIGTLVDLDDCDGYVVLAVDPQTGEVDAHGPFGGLGAVAAADDLRATFDREELDDVVVRIVRWHTNPPAAGSAA